MTPYQSPWAAGWRSDTWDKLHEPWDVVVIGGGITGAGILALAARMGLAVLLLEQNDFASGTSSRSSKLVHGGLRYLRHIQLRLTWESVHERQRLLTTAPGLVTPLNFIYPIYEGDSPGARTIEFGLGLYTRMARSAGSYDELAPVDLLMLAPGLTQRRLLKGYLYGDAQTDDARLVLRVVHDALLAGHGRAAALNYARVVGLVRVNGQVVGVRLQDENNGREAEVLADLVINATGAWASQWSDQNKEAPRLRPLRGSHLFFRCERFPVYQAVSMLHPQDGRPVFALPWEGVTLLGTTDVDHADPLDREPAIAADEASYLLAAAQTFFPEFELTPADVLSTQAGVRPVVDSGKQDPSQESRDHVIWHEDGMLNVTGGKLTTFRLVALDVLKAAQSLRPEWAKPGDDLPVLEATDSRQPLPGIDGRLARRLRDRYGAAAPQIAAAPAEWLTTIPGTPYLWAELAWAAQNEGVLHLDDLLLRRLRCGILLPDGGLDATAGGLSLPSLVQPALGWDNDHWAAETDHYRRIRQIAHGLPAGWS